MSRAFSDAFVLTYRGQDFVRQWIEECAAPSSDLACFRVFWETDWSIVGGRPTSGGALLFSNLDGRPVRYELRADGAPLRAADFGADATRITLGDGSTRELHLSEPPTLVFQNNVVLLLTNALRQGRSDTNEVKGSCFLPDALRSRPLTFVREAVHRWSCDLGLTLDVDDEFRLQRVTTRDAEVDGHPVTETFPTERFAQLETPARRRYQPPEPRRYEQHDVTIAGEIPIGGTLCLPSEKRPVPGVLFLKGSGRQDRHGFVDGIDTGAHSICDFAADEGFATLRFDARGAGSTPFGNPFQPMLRTRHEDTRAALAYLFDRPEVDADRIALIGHSLGAITALHLASQGGKRGPRALALLAPPGRPLEEILGEQAVREARRLEMSGDEQRRRSDLVSRALDREVRDAPNRDAQIGEHSYANAVTALRDDYKADPAALLRLVRCPILLCYGERDIQVNATRDGERLLAEAQRMNVPCALRVYPSLDHLFRKVSGSPSPSDYFRALPVDASFLEDLIAWLRAMVVERAPDAPD